MSEAQSNDMNTQPSHEAAAPADAVSPPAVQEPSAQNSESTVENENFAELFAEQEANELPGAHLTPGQRVKATIVAVTDDTVFVSTGTKVDGIVERAELEEKDGPPCAIGDQLDLYVVAVSPQEVRLSKMMSGAGGLSALEDAREARLPVEGKIKAVVKGGFAVEVMKRRAFCPLGQMDLHPIADPESFIGKAYPFIVTKVEKNGRNIVISRRILLEAEQAESQKAFIGTVSIGDVCEGTVIRTAPFGAFVELAPGVEGLIHLSELSWARVSQVGEAVSAGDTVRVKILEISQTEKGMRISLSARQVMDDPWTTVTETLHDGDVVQGKVIRTTSFGAFVEVLPGIEGLIHISELSYEKRIHKAEEVVTPGETVSVKIKGLDLDKKRLSLSLRDVGGNPWDTVAETFSVGQELTGTVEKRAVFGVFITLSPGVTGLLPASAISSARNKAGFDKAQPGDAVQVCIKEIDSAARKVTLSIPGAETSGSSTGGGGGKNMAEEKDWKKHAPKPAATSFGGTLGLAMKMAMNKKK